jgi:hypothetical protein
MYGGSASPFFPRHSTAPETQSFLIWSSAQSSNEEFKIRKRKYELYSGGEDLFALPQTEFPELGLTEKELALQVLGVHSKSYPV